MSRWVSSPANSAVINLIVTVRNAAGLTQRDLAKRLGKHPSFIAKIEAGERSIGIVEFIAITRQLGDDRELMDRLLKALPANLDI
jgi:transcriptional regulator with XRE-family HTH domain